MLTRSFTTNFPEFIPHPLLRDPHLMTLAPSFWPRLGAEIRQARRSGELRQFEVEPGISVLTRCHWQPDARQRPTLLVIHGLEGSAESGYVVGITFKAFHQGMNVVRMNLRNCGGSMHLTPTLYNGGLSADVLRVLEELRAEGFGPVFIAGCSLGGNIVLKAAGELGRDGVSLLAGVAAISPSVDLDRCVAAIEMPHNRIYELWFLRTLKQKIREKARTHPHLYDINLLAGVKTMRQFDDVFTAPAGGYGNAANYYSRASAVRVMQQISVPTLIIAAQDDPLIPFSLFEPAVQNNANIHLLATRYGGHAGYIHHAPERHPTFDCFWAENRIVEFCQEVGNRR